MRECAYAYCLTALAGLAAALPAAAQDYPTRTIGAWTVSASSDKTGCFTTRTYSGDGATTLLLGMSIDDDNHLSVLNENWSIRPQEQLKLTFRMTNGGYTDQRVVGMASDGKRGFVTNFEAKFPGYFASSKALHIFRGKVPVEKLDLSGSGAAVAELRRCVALYKDAPVSAVVERSRPTDIPKDPFARDTRR